MPPVQAKLVKLGKDAKVKLTVDIQSGKLFCVKPSKDILDESNMFTHDKGRYKCYVGGDGRERGLVEITGRFEV